MSTVPPEYQALENAVRAYVAEMGDGAYLTGWTLTASAASAGDPNATEYVYATHQGPPHEWLGLLAMAERRAARVQTEGDE